MRPVNLLPEEYRPRNTRAGGGGGAGGGSYVLLGVLGALMLGVLLYVVTTNQVTSRKNEASQLEAEAKRAEARATSLQAYESFAGIKTTREASVRYLAGNRFDWERTMRELARVLPRTAWLTDLDASAAGDATAATTPPTGSTGAATPGGPTMKLSGCVRDRPEVATTLVRLRQMHNVQDVQLGEVADQGDSDAAPGAPAGGATPAAPGAAGAGCGDGYSFDATVLFRPATATAATPERQKVSESLGGGS